MSQPFLDSPKQILVTGGAGFIGSHLVASLVAQGHHVQILDNLSSGHRENLAGLDVTFRTGDISDWATVQEAVAQVDLIFHQAALVSVPQSISDPQQNYASNVTGTYHVFEAARQAGLKPLVYASSAAVYGDTPTLPAVEDALPHPLSPYAAAKLMGEQLATAYNHSYGTRFLGLRYFNVYGPRQNPTSPYSGVLSIFCQKALAGQTATIYGDGHQTRDFVYVADVVAANLAAANLAATQTATPTIFNVGTGKPTSLLTIVETMSSIQPLRITHEADRAGDIRHSCADITRSQHWLETTSPSCTSLREGLEATVGWLRHKNAAS